MIENGKIAEGGTHAELLKLRGHYYRLYTQQFRHQLEVQYGVSDDEGSDVLKGSEVLASESVASD